MEGNQQQGPRALRPHRQRNSDQQEHERASWRDHAPAHVPDPDVHGLTRPRVRLASSSMDEGMFSVLVRVDELLRVREQCGDTYVLDRIEALYKSRFRDFGL